MQIYIENERGSENNQGDTAVSIGGINQINTHITQSSVSMTQIKTTLFFWAILFAFHVHMTRVCDQ